MQAELERVVGELGGLDRAQLLAVVERLVRLLEPMAEHTGRVAAQAHIQEVLMMKARVELAQAHAKLVTKHAVGKDAGHCGVCAAYYSLEAVELKP